MLFWMAKLVGRIEKMDTLKAVQNYYVQESDHSSITKGSTKYLPVVFFD